MGQHGSKYFLPADPLIRLGQNQLYQNIVMQIKWNHECSNMVANILHADSPLTLGLGLKVKIQLFQNIVMLHTKLKVMTHAGAW